MKSLYLTVPTTQRGFTVHGSPCRMTRAPFTRQCWGLPHELAHCAFPGSAS